MTKLTKKANVEFFQRKRNDREMIVQDGVFAEDLQSKGITLQDLVNDARKVLEVGEDDAVRGSYEKQLKQQNVEAQAFISLVNSITNLEETGMISAEQAASLRDAEDRLAEKLAKRYDVDVELLYVEEELGEDQ